MSRVEGKVAIVTGGASGIGRMTCLVLAKEGAKVAVVDIDDAAGKKVVSEIEGSGGTAQFWHMDVTSAKEVEKTFADIYKAFGKINILVNDAGINGVPVPVHEVKEEDWDRVININLKGPFHCTKFAVPYMLKGGGGSVVNLSSFAGIVGMGGDTPYHASKGGLRLMTKTDAITYAKDNIRFNSVHPGAIRTPLLDGFIKGNAGDNVEEFIKGMASMFPLGFGDPIDIANGILYLASDESKYVTGSELVIDGGYTAK
jgi:NAD(P)-dependent dehydrogenase (short-subunit alcohol dehydrogenase family)